MKRYRAPIVVLLLQAALLAMVLAGLGKLRPHRVPDTPSYEDFPFDSLSAGLEHSRTFGYPLLLRCVSGLAPSGAAAPAVQFLMHVGAVAVFWSGLARIIRSPWISLGVASPLLYSNMTLRYINDLIPDAPASSMSIAAVGFLLLAVIPPHRQWRWAALAGCVFAAYQLRPAYLFLTLLLPPLGVCLAWLLHDRTTSDRQQYRGLLLRLACLTLLPLIAFCGARGLLVGQFSLVAFGGNNFAGVVTSFLDDEVASHLMGDTQRLAEDVLQRRRSVARRDPALSAEPTRSYTRIESGFDAATWKVCVPAARAMYGDNWPRVNRALRRLSWAIIRERPGDYLIWLAKALVRGVYMVVSEQVRNPIYFLLLWVLGLLHFRYVVRRRNAGAAGRQAGREDAADAWFLQINALWLIAVSFAGSKILLVILTTPPLGRFMDAAGVFLPTILAAAISRYAAPSEAAMKLSRSVQS